MAKEQTANKRADGRFTKGNKVGHRFKPGESGNPAGRPKVLLPSEAIRKELAKELPEAEGKTVAEAIAERLCKEAMDGNVAAIREVCDRIEGKPRQALDVEMAIHDWRELARTYGLDESDVLTEAQLLITESASDNSREEAASETGGRRGR